MEFMLTCHPVLPTATRSVPTPTTCTPRMSNKLPPTAFCPYRAAFPCPMPLGPQKSSLPLEEKKKRERERGGGEKGRKWEGRERRGEKKQEHDFILQVKKLKLWEVKEIAQDNTLCSRVGIPICLPPKSFHSYCGTFKINSFRLVWPTALTHAGRFVFVVPWTFTTFYVNFFHGTCNISLQFLTCVWWIVRYLKTGGFPAYHFIPG